MATLKRVNLNPSDVDLNTVTSRLILRVHPASPADVLGIRKGWLLLRIGDAAPTDAAVKSAESGSAHNFLFASETGATYALEEAKWPFGIVTVPWPGKEFVTRISGGDFEIEALMLFWKEGVLTPYSTIGPAIDKLMSQPPTWSWRWWFGLPATREQVAQSPGWVGHLLLALSAAVDGKTRDADFFLSASRASRDRSTQASFSSIELALDAYVESMVAEQDGEVDRALHAITTAKRLAPEIPEVETRLARLEKRPPKEELPRWTLERFPVDYVLPAHDPVGEITASMAAVAFREVVGSLAEGEMLVVLVLGQYRSNYYYNLDLQRLAVLNRVFRGRLREVHVITSGTYALDDEHRRQAEGEARRLQLPFVILWDEGNKVGSAVEPEGSPARFVVDRTGRVLATERFMEEEGFWKAISRIGESP